MRLIIHYVGDVHQPLHATSRVDHEYPKGDFGGNTVKLPAKDGVTNLHALWDSVSYEYSGYAKLPFTDSDWDLNGKRAQDLVSKHPLSSLKADVPILTHNNGLMKAWLFLNPSYTRELTLEKQFHQLMFQRLKA